MHCCMAIFQAPLTVFWCPYYKEASPLRLQVIRVLVNCSGYLNPQSANLITLNFTPAFNLTSMKPAMEPNAVSPRAGIEERSWDDAFGCCGYLLGSLMYNWLNQRKELQWRL